MTDVPDRLGSQETVLFIGGSTERLLLGAEMMDLMKEYRDGNMREFTTADIENFRGGGTLQCNNSVITVDIRELTWGRFVLMLYYCNYT